MRLVRLLASAFLWVAQPAFAIPFDATLSFSVDIARSFGPVSFTGSGTGTSAPALVQLPSGVFSGTAGDPNRLVIGSLGNLAGGFSGTPLAGQMPILGAARIHVGGGFGTAEVPLAVTAHGAGSQAQVVAGAGVGGTASGTFQVVGYTPPTQTFEFSAKFAPFSAGTVAFDVYTYHFPVGQQASMVTATFSYTGTAPPPAPYRTVLSRMGSDARTPGGLGQIVLVSPSRIEVEGFDYLVWATLTVSFVPEPGTALLLGSGVLGLAALGRRLARSARPRAGPQPRR